MIEELHTASSLLRAALQKYLDTCFAFASYYDAAATPDCPSQSFLDNIVGELKLIDSYEKKIKQAKAVIRQRRNSTPSIVPISTLPSDMLVHIFQLVLRSESCYFKGPNRPDPNDIHSDRRILNFPDLTLQVCSRWRQVAINSPGLWTHVDLGLRAALCKRLISRARHFATRSQTSPVDIHIIRFLGDVEFPRTDLVDLCALLAPQTRSLDIPMHSGSMDLSRSILRSFFEKCTPGTLVKLTISSSSQTEKDRFFEAAENPTNPQSWLFDLPHVEGILLGVRTLRLCDVYPYWTSKAYHGLVELRLHTYASGLKASIPESQLIGILAACPELRIFHFGLIITVQPSGDTLPVSVKLRYLEEFRLMTMAHSDRHDTMLRWLSLGSNPLRMSLQLFRGMVEFLFTDAFIEFCACSYITQFDLRGATDALPLHDLLSVMPSAQTLSLYGFVVQKGAELQPDPACQSASEPPQLDVMYIQDCSFNVEDLHWVARMHPIQVITACNCWFPIEPPGNTISREYMTKDVLENGLSGIVPVVNLLPLEQAEIKIDYIGNYFSGLP